MSAVAPWKAPAANHRLVSSSASSAAAGLNSKTSPSSEPISPAAAWQRSHSSSHCGCSPVRQAYRGHRAGALQRPVQPKLVTEVDHERDDLALLVTPHPQGHLDNLVKINIRSGGMR